MMTESKGMTPLQRSVFFRSQNCRLLRSITDLKNQITGLSPKTREAWKNFVDCFWDDMKFQQNQIDLYKADHQESSREVQEYNQRIYSKEARMRKLEKEQKFLEERYTCTRCKDTGDTLTKNATFCTCETGIAKFKEKQASLMFNQHPNWFIEQVTGAAKCLDCQRNFKNGMTYHTCTKRKTGG